MIQNAAQIESTFAALNAIIQEAQSHSRKLRAELDTLLDESDTRFAPLCDPLRVNTGLNRWLRREREEAYSDWLKWVLEQIKDADLLLRLFQVNDGGLLQLSKNQTAQIDREYPVPGGRLDLVIHFGHELLLVLEIKTVSTDYADTDKQRGYMKWIQDQREYRRKECVFLGIDNPPGCNLHGFRALLWQDLCLSLRSMVPRIFTSPSGGRSAQDTVKASMVIAFISAVESNLLNLAHASEDPPHSSLIYVRTANHLRASLGKGNAVTEAQFKDASTLLVEGATIYPRALEALEEFRQLITAECRKALERDLSEISRAMNIDVTAKDLRDGCTETQKVDGVYGWIGVQIIGREGPWWLYCYVLWSGGHLEARVSLWCKNRDMAKSVLNTIQANCDIPEMLTLLEGAELAVTQKMEAHEMTQLPAILANLVANWKRMWQSASAKTQIALS